MPSNLQAYRQMAEHATLQITGSHQSWMAFLQTASRLYKYPYNEQLMIYAQRPEATACAEYEFWNQQWGRYVRRGSKGIAVIDTSGDNPKLKYVFDVSDTGTRENSRAVRLWELRPEHIDSVTAMLERNYDVSGGSGLADQLERVAAQLADEYRNSHQRDILDILEDSFLEEYDDFNVGVQFRNAATVSITYALMSRCGLKPDNYFEHEDFLSVFDFNTPSTVAVLGTTVSEINQQVLRQIEITVKNYERIHSAERAEHEERTDLQQERRLPDSRSDTLGAVGDEPRQVREDTKKLPEGAPSGAMESPDTLGEAILAPTGDRRDGEPALGADDARADEPERSDREPESVRPDEVDRADEQPESTGGRNHIEGVSVQLSFFPTEQEQITLIDEAESVAYTPFAFSFAQEDIDTVLRLGGNNDNSRMRVAAEYMKQKPQEEITAFLSREYRGGAGFVKDNSRFSAWFTEDGIRLSQGNSARYSSAAQVIPWQDATARIGKLLEQGQFATNVELAETDSYTRSQLAESLWYLRHDFDKPAIERRYLSIMEDFRGGGLPDETERLAEALAHPEYRATITKDYEQFFDAYREDRGLLRFHYQRTGELLNGLHELALPWREYSTGMVEPPKMDRFITEDEINAALTYGSSVEGGKARIYAYFTEKHTPKEQVDFLINEYGIGGHNNALPSSFRSNEDHSGKGIRIQKPDCYDVQLSWNNVAKRISELVRQGRYFTPEEITRYEQRQQEKAFAADVQIINAEAGTVVDRTIDDPETHVPDQYRPITQDDIDEALRVWNGDPASKRAVVQYMTDHARDKGTAAWLAREYGTADTKTLSVTRTGTDLVVELSWAKVQRRIVQLIQKDHFYTDRELDGFADIDTAAIRESLGSTKAQKRVDAMLEAAVHIATENAVEQEKFEPVEPEQTPAADSNTMNFPYSVGDTVYLEDSRAFIIENIGDSTIEMRDPTLFYPIWRAESRENFARLIEQYPQQTQASAEIQPEPENFRITDDNLGVGGAKAKFRMNMGAINTLLQIESESRGATSEEQEVLAKYVGWGGLADAFDDTKQNWANEYQELAATLTPEEYATARASTLNAHYTSPTVIKAIYEAVSSMGFTTGNILEPAMGVGNFFGCLPEEMSGSKLYGVELDSLTGRIAKQLYPKADITVAGFETTDRRDFFDLAIGNVPFGQYQVNDRAYNKLGFSIHDYFFAKSLDQVSPSGVIAFVTSRYTMDKQSPEVRKYIAQRAELLGAIRLPNNTFRANARTNVVSDIIFLQKRDRPIISEPEWVFTGRNDDGFTINSYFVDHPEMILGRQTSESTQYGKQDFTVEPIDGLNLADQLSDAVKNIRGTYAEAELPELGEGSVYDTQEIDTSIPADPNVKNYSYTIVDGDVYFRENSRMVKPDLNATAKERVKGMVELRDCAHELIEQQLDGFFSDAAIRQTQAELNDLYDDFTAKYGLINSRGNAIAFSDDSSYYLLCSLEVLDEEGNLDRKADMFTKRTIKSREVVTSVDTASEALALSISEKAGVDMAYMSQLTGKTEDELASELRGVIFVDPTNEKYATADEYLSGNVREKLRLVRLALPADTKFQSNIDALTAAQPRDLDASEIEVRLGATWIDKDYIQEFMLSTFEPPYYLRRSVEVNYSDFTAEWNISGKSAVAHSNIKAFMTYGTDRASAYRILEDTLNLRDVRIYDTVQDTDGKERRVLNSKETTIAQQKQQAIKDAFQDWIWRDPDRRQTLVEKYNEIFNSCRPREYDGRHITFSGMNPEIRLREHQLNAVAHVLYGGNTLLAHEVGAGKTFEMVAAAMESKRLGLCQKSLFAVPNHLIEQWASELLRLYPSANILVATKKDFEIRNRKKFCARIATGDYDAVIIGHSQFERIPMSQERQERLLQEQIDEIEDGIAELQESHAERFTIKQLERTRKSLEARLEKLHSGEKKDDVVTFEQLGVDRLFVDEAHNYKNCFLFTKMRNVAGLSTTDAQKSSDMLLKCRYIDEITNNKGVVFATGTPVSNSMTELYVMMRYLQHNTIKEQGLSHFDCWASTFGETTTAIELAPEGTGYRARTRFAKFFNLPELMTMFKEAADIKTADQLNLPTPMPIYHNIVAQPTELQKDMVQELSERAAAVHSGTIDPSQDNMLKITSDGRKLGLDQRVINPDLPDAPQSKVNLCVDNIYRIWEEGQPEKLTQLVFSDLSTPKTTAAKNAAKAVAGNLDNPELSALERLPDKENDDGDAARFTIYDDIRDKLVTRGIPWEQIAFIHEANTEVHKKGLYAKVRSGNVRVLLGSTFKMGSGMNVQDRLVALHDLDCPWRPGDLEQRSGRIIRQGNRNKKVHIFRYVTEGTFDSYLWQTVENKQKFISQIMTSKSPVRSCEDVDATALSYAEIKALCAGDDRIREKMDLDVDVARLKLMKANHQSQQYRLEDNLVRYFPEQIEQYKGFIAGFKADIATLAAHPHPEDGFAGMEVKGDALTDKDNAGAAILEAFKDSAVISGRLPGLEPVLIGSYRGFVMSLTVEDFGREFVLTLKGQMSHRVTLGKDARGNLTRIDNVLAAMPERLKTVRDKLDSLYSQMDAAKAETGKPFPQEAELQQKSARLAELNAALNIDDRTPIERLADRPEKATRPSVLEKLRTQPVRDIPDKAHKKEIEER